MTTKTAQNKNVRPTHYNRNNQTERHYQWQEEKQLA